MDKKLATVDSYNKSATSIANKFDEQGARVSDIEEVFNLFKKEDPSVFEIGCGNGRDAKEITKHTKNYLGMDIAEELIRLAKEKVPEARFEIGDIETYVFPKDLDLIFAFASLLHVNRDSLQKILFQAYESLNKDGVFRISLKYADSYKEIEKEDKFGKRTFYLYFDTDIKEMAGNFKILKLEKMDLRGQEWLEVILQK